MPVVISPAPSSLPPSGAAGGDLGGTYPNPTVDLASGGTITGPVVVSTGVPSNLPLTITGAAAQSNDFMLIQSSTGDVFIEVEDGDLDIRATPGGQPRLRMRSSRVDLTDNASSNVIHGASSLVTLGSQQEVQVLASGAFAVKTNGPPADVPNNAVGFWFDNSAAATNLRLVGKDFLGAEQDQIVEQASPITSGALPTLTITSGTGRQILVARATETVTPFSGDGTNNAATCAIALSPDNSTYSTVATVSIAAALNLTGVLTDNINVRVPAGWYIKLTATHGTLGTTSYY